MRKKYKIKKTDKDFTQFINIKKLKLILVFLIFLSFIIIAFPTDSFAYTSVRGYFKPSTGTYVNSYVRTSPNAFKFDNYSWTPSQGLYNKSYYAPTKNYSSDWYTPSYITDPYYYLGKSFYESGQSGLNLYTTPKSITPSYIPYYSPGYTGIVGGETGISVPILPASPKSVDMICAKNEYLSIYGDTCYCDSGYKRNLSGICEKVICGPNEHLSTWSDECYCDSGYKKNYSTGICEKVICGPNEHLSTWSDECYCDSGYKKNYSTGICEKIIIPSNAHLDSWSSQGWYCDTGYKQIDNSCQPK